MKLRNIAVVFLILFATAIAGCITAEQTQHNIVKVSPDEAYRLIQENKNNPNFVIVDIRTPQEYNSGHIENAININFYDPDFKQKLSKLDRDKTYVVYCRTGQRSGLAMPIFRELGFKEVYEIEGGIVRWVKSGYSVIK